MIKPLKKDALERPPKPKPRATLALMGVVVAATYWLVESIMHAYVFNLGGFVTQLTPHDWHELWMRVLVAGCIMALGITGQALLNSRRRVEWEQKILIARLRETLAEVKTLRGLIPICSHCKKIRNDRGAWEQLEAYLKKHSHAEFSHGICPQCLEHHYGNFLASRRKVSDSK